MTNLDDRKITHLICVRLRHLLYDFLGGVLGLLYQKNNRKETPPSFETPPPRLAACEPWSPKVLGFGANSFCRGATLTK